MKAGLMKLHVLDLGRLRSDPNGLVGGSVMPTRSQPKRTLELATIPCSAYCIEHADGNILYDLGCHPQAMGPDGRWSEFLQEIVPYDGDEECQLPNRLAQIGLWPDDIRYAVLSHLHNDHSGCVEFFRKTQLIVHRHEFQGAFESFGLRREQSPYVLRDLAVWASRDLNWRLVEPEEGDMVLADGVELLNLGAGHSFGMLGLHVQLPGTGSVLLVSDAIYGAANYERPVRLPGFMTDAAGYRRTVERIRQIAQRCQGQVWFGHDMQQFETLRKSTEGWYE
jgi:N-acyl homoserine lactone hydrolase